MLFLTNHCGMVPRERNGFLPDLLMEAAPSPATGHVPSPLWAAAALCCLSATLAMLQLEKKDLHEASLFPVRF